MNAKRFARIWRQEGSRAPARLPKRGRLWLNDGSCIRLRPNWKNRVRAYDFFQERTHDGRAFRMLVVVDEFSRECLAILVARRLNGDDMLALLTELLVIHRPPDHIRSPFHRLLSNRLPGKGATDRSSAPTPSEIGSSGWRLHPVHRAGQPLGERLPEVVQRQA